MAHTDTGIDTIERTLQKTNLWIREMEEELVSTDRQHAFQALRAVLQTLRDRLPMAEAIDLGDQLPILIRGFYYENWTPAKKPVREHNLEEFLEHVIDRLPKDADVLDVEDMVRAVFNLLKNHVSEGEIKDVRSNMPDYIAPLWK